MGLLDRILKHMKRNHARDDQEEKLLDTQSRWKQAQARSNRIIRVEELRLEVAEQQYMTRLRGKGLPR